MGELLSIATRSFANIDRGEAVASLEYFADEATLEFCEPAPNAGILTGKSAIQGFLENRMAMGTVKSSHIIHNFIVESTCSGRADATFVMVVYRGTHGVMKPEIVSVANVNDSYFLDGENWEIVSRKIQPIFSF